MRSGQAALRLCRFESVAPGIELAWIDLAELMRRCLPESAAADYRTRQPLRVAQDDPRLDWLGPAEVRQVNGFKSLKRQVEWMGGRLALKALAQGMVLSEMPLAGIAVAQDAQGAPFLPAAPAVCISLSHSHERVVAGAALAGQRLGLDLERVDAGNWTAVARLALSAREQARYADAGPETLCALWVLKEAYLKLIGQGFHTALTTVEVLGGDLWHHERRVAGIQRLTRQLDSGHAFAALWQQTPPAAMQLPLA